MSLRAHKGDTDRVRESRIETMFVLGRGSKGGRGTYSELGHLAIKVISLAVDYLNACAYRMVRGVFAHGDPSGERL